MKPGKEAEPRCPVCRASFRETNECSRCGADLTAVMHLMARAYRLRREAREALFADDLQQARRLALEAQFHCAGETGRRLEKLALWLDSSRTTPQDETGEERYDLPPPPDDSWFPD